MIDFSAYDPLGEDVGWPSSVSDDDAYAAGDAIRRECGWHIAPSKTVTVGVEAGGGRILSLPSLHVTAVTSVLDSNGDAVTDFRLTQYSQLELPRWQCWAYDEYTITMTHGFAETPRDVVAVIVDMARDYASASATAGNVRQVSLDGASFSYSDAAGARRDICSAYPQIGRYKL